MYPFSGPSGNVPTKWVFFAVILAVWTVVFPSASSACLIALPLLMGSRVYLRWSLVLALTILLVFCMPTDVWGISLIWIQKLFPAAQLLITVLCARKRCLLDDSAAFVESRWQNLLRQILGWGVFFGCASLLFKPVPILTALAWTAIYSCFWVSVGRLTRLRPKRVEWTAVNVLLFLASTVGALVAAELFGRWIFEWKPPAQTIVQLDPEYMFLHKPSSCSVGRIAVSPTKTGPVYYAINAQGMRGRTLGPKANGEFRILMLGDSFTFGNNVGEENTIAAFLETSLQCHQVVSQVTVINGGLAAAGPLQELGTLRRYGLALQPDLVILQLFAENDVDNSLSVVGKRQRAYLVGWHRTLQERLREAAFSYRVEAFLRERLILYQHLSSAFGDRRLAVECLALLRVVPNPEEPLPPSEDRESQHEINLRDWYPELHEGMAILERDIVAIRDECVLNGIDLMAYCIPYINELDEKTWNDSMARHPDIAYERFKGDRLFVEFLEREGIRQIPVLDMLMKHPDPLSIWNPYDGHCNKSGYKLIADCIAGYLLDNYFKASGATESGRKEEAAR